MFSKFNSVSSDIPNQPDPAAQAQKSHRGFGKKPLLVLAAVVAIAIILIAMLATPGASAAIPLNVNYVVGEKMVYTTDMSVAMNLGNSSLFNFGSLSSNNSIAVSGTKTVEVVGFDGQLYTLNSTSTIDALGKSVSFSVIEKMNKTGYTTTIFNFGSATMEISSGTGLTNYESLTQLLSQPEVKVGDSVTIPYPGASSSMPSNIQVSGDLVLTFKGTQDLTVPAGTYKAFEVDLTSRNLKMTVQIPSSESSYSIMPSSLSMDIDLSYKMYFEYNTMRPIQSSMQATATLQTSIISYSMTLGMDTTLNQDIKPN
jgi:hypothetical protein